MSENTIIRQRRRNHFVQIPNETARDPRLSWKATGLHCYLLSLPDDWKINLQHLAGAKKDGRDATRGGLAELEKAGYLRKEVLRDELGKIEGTVWVVSDFPLSENPKPGNPKAGNPTLQIPSEQKPKDTNTKPHPQTPGGGGGGGEPKGETHESLDELVEAAWWQASAAGAIKNAAGWRAKVRARLAAGASADDLLTLEQWRAAKAAAEQREREAAERLEGERKAQAAADESRKSGNSQAGLDACLSILKPRAAA